MNDLLKLIFIAAMVCALCYFIWLLIELYKKQKEENIKIQEPSNQSKLVYEKTNLDARIKSLEDYLASDLTVGSNIIEVRKVLITEQLAVMRRYSNVLAVRIALNGNKP